MRLEAVADSPVGLAEANNMQIAFQTSQEASKGSLWEVKTVYSHISQGK